MIVATKDGAVGKHRLLTVGVCGYPHLIELQGGYEDVYVKTKDGWRFKSRIHVFKQAPSLAVRCLRESRRTAGRLSRVERVHS